MSLGLNQLPPKAALVEVARDFHSRGWMLGTAGNLSMRVRGEEDSFWITASAQPKGRLEQQDLLRVRVGDGEVVEQGHFSDKPSSETLIHLAIYRLSPEVRACLHVHTVDACLAAVRAPAHASGLPLPPLEMLKGLGIWDERPTVELPLFDNDLEVERIAAAITERFRAAPPIMPGLVIRDHGVTVWGNSIQDAYNHVEVMEFFMSYLARSH